MAKPDRYRLGTGAGFSADRLDPALELVAKGRLDVVVFECIGERPLAFGHRDRMADRAGWLQAAARAADARAAAALRRGGTRLDTNMGARIPKARPSARPKAHELELRGLKDRRGCGR